MFGFLLRRLALTIPTFIALMFVTFVAIRLVPGDPVEVRVGERGISPALAEHHIVDPCRVDPGALDQRLKDYCAQISSSDRG